VTADGPSLRLAYLYPDLMNLYADRGNITCLERRCAWRGITPLVQRLEWNDRLDESADMYVIGGGQDRQQQLASQGLTMRNADRILSDLGDGAVMLAVCGGYQLMAHRYRAGDGSELAGLGVFDAETVHPGPDTAALSIADDTGGRIALQAIRDSGGTAVEVTDEAIFEALHRAAGVGVSPEPASAAALAGAWELARRGVIDPGDFVVCCITGAGPNWPDVLSGRVPGEELVNPGQAVLDGLMSGQ